MKMKGLKLAIVLITVIIVAFAISNYPNNFHEQKPKAGQIRTQDETPYATAIPQPASGTPKFNKTAFSDTYFDILREAFTRNLTLEDVKRLEAVSNAAPSEALDELSEGEWFANNNIPEHVIHSITGSYDIAIQNITPYCLPHEADHLYYYTKFNATGLINDSIQKLPGLLKNYEAEIRRYSNASTTFARINITKVEESAAKIEAMLKNGNYSTPETLDEINFLRAQPC